MGIFLCAGAIGPKAQAAVTEPYPKPVTVRLTKGSANVTRDPRTVTPQNPQGDPLSITPDNCDQIRDEIIRFDGLTRQSGQNVYKCIIERQAIVSFKPNTSCAPPRPPETRQGACPGDPTHTFTQTRRWSIAPAPTCEVPGAWEPLTPTTTECPPLQLAAPTGVTAATTTPNCAAGQCTIRITWNVVPDALSYQVRRCIGTACDPASQPPLNCTTTRQVDHVTLGRVSVTYQVLASRRDDCSADLGAPSATVTAASFGGGTGSEPPRSACSGRVCQLRWTPTEPPRAEGFRVVYGRAPTELTGVIQVVPGTVTSTQVTLPATGVWYFGVLSFLEGVESALSNVEVRTVQ